MAIMRLAKLRALLEQPAKSTLNEVRPEPIEIIGSALIDADDDSKPGRIRRRHGVGCMGRGVHEQEHRGDG
jgi:hypothetical protein